MTAIRGLNPHFRLTSTEVHGGGRRPEREFTVDPAELEAWTKANERARLAYYLTPSACTTAIWKGGFR